MFYAVIYP
uniref:Uncharacterized protein n=1 Tax=Anguilla anguilla TaxID=7936 RepID=A0A0E9TJE5_ANGAN